MTEQHRWPIALLPFRRRDFGLLWAGGLVSIVGSWMQTIAVGALVTSQTREGDLGRARRRRGVPADRPAVAGRRRARRPAAAPRRCSILGNVAEAFLAAVLAVLVGAGWTTARRS